MKMPQQDKSEETNHQALQALGFLVLLCGLGVEGSYPGETLNHNLQTPPWLALLDNFNVAAIPQGQK